MFGGLFVKTKNRIKIAHDMCVKQLFSFRMSTFLMALTFVILGLVIYQYKSSYSYRMRVEESFAKPMEDVYYLLSTSGNDFPDISKIDGMTGFYHTQISDDITECIYFLNEVQGGHKIGEITDGVEVFWVFGPDLDLYNIRMTESIPQEELDNTPGIRLYLSEKYKSITGLGEHYTQKNWDYVVAGYFSEDSVMPALNVTSTGTQDGAYSLEYGVIEIGGLMPISQAGYFYCDPSVDSFENIRNQIVEEYARCNATCTITNVEKSITYMEKNITKALKYLVIAAILLGSSCIIVLLVSQVSNILTRSEEYGIWLTNKATKKDIMWILIWQNLIKLIYSEIFAILVINLGCRFVIFGENFQNTAISHRISNRIITFNIYPAIIGVGILIVTVSIIVPLLKIARTEPVKLVKGEL